MLMLLMLLIMMLEGGVESPRGLFVLIVLKVGYCALALGKTKHAARSACGIPVTMIIILFNRHIMCLVSADVACGIPV